MNYELILLGVLVSILYTELTGFTPGGLIVPGYLVLYLQDPGRIAATVLIALLSLGICRLLGRVVILYGRRSFAVMILLSFGLNWLLGAGLPLAAPGAIGFLIPGILARDFDRQGIGQSLLSLGIVMGILALLLLFMGHPMLGPAGGLS